MATKRCQFPESPFSPLNWKKKKKTFLFILHLNLHFFLHVFSPDLLERIRELETGKLNPSRGLRSPYSVEWEAITK